MNESPLFVRTYDFLLWFIPHVQKYPRAYRFTLSEHMQRLILGFQDEIVAAGKSPGSERLKFLHSADIRLEQLRLWLRMAQELKLMTIAQYDHCSKGIAEIGRLLGAWIKLTRDLPQK